MVFSHRCLKEWLSLTPKWAWNSTKSSSSLSQFLFRAQQNHWHGGVGKVKIIHEFGRSPRMVVQENHVVMAPPTYLKNGDKLKTRCSAGNAPIAKTGTLKPGRAGSFLRGRDSTWVQHPTPEFAFTPIHATLSDRNIFCISYIIRIDYSSRTTNLCCVSSRRRMRRSLRDPKNASGMFYCLQWL